MPRYQLCSKNVFLTYSQCPLQKEYLLEQLRIKIGNDASIRVGHEMHQDEGHHLHVFITNPTDIRTRDQRFFDVEGYHPNIQSARKRKECYTYCGKDGDFIDDGPAFEFREDKRRWEEIHDAETPEQVRELVKKVSPRDSVVNFDKIEAFIRFKFQDKVVAYSSARDITDFTIPQEMLDWTEQMNEVKFQGGYARQTFGLRRDLKLNPNSNLID